MLSEATPIIANHYRPSPRNTNCFASSNPAGTFGIVHILKNSGSYFLGEGNFSQQGTNVKVLRRVAFLYSRRGEPRTSGLDQDRQTAKAHKGHAAKISVSKAL